MGKHTDEKELSLATDPELLKVTHLVHEIWSGQRVDRYLQDRDFQCPSIQVGQWQSLPSEYFKCHWEFLNCALKYEFDTRVDLQSLSYLPVLPLEVKLDEVLGPIGLLGLKQKASGEYYQLKLQTRPLCNRVVLPKGKYEAGLGQEMGSPKQVYEVFNKIEIDRRLFDYGKLRLLKKLNPQKLQSIKDAKEKFWYEAVAGLSATQMQRLCEVGGQEIMRSEYLDAVSFIPKSIEQKHQNEFKALYIFSHNSELATAIEGEACDAFAAKECPKDNFYFKPHFSWNGVTQLHGGLMEYAPAKFKREAAGNVWPSSHFFSKESIFHHIGVRIKWDGVDQMRQNLDFSHIKTKEEVNLPEQLAIGFRCLKVLP